MSTDWTPHRDSDGVRSARQYLNYIGVFVSSCVLAPAISTYYNIGLT